SAVLWPPMKVWREARDDNHRGATQNHAGRPEPDCDRRPAGNITRKRFEEGTVIRRFSARSDERGGRCAQAALPEDQAATGPSALPENVRPVRFRLSAFHRRAADPRTTDAALRA